MSAIHSRYLHEMHQRFGQFACWPPNTPLKLGDVGVLRRDKFEKVTTLAELGVRSLPDETGAPVLLEYSSAGQVHLAVDGEAQASVLPSPVGGMVSISFGREGATFFQAVDAVRESITDLPKLEKALAPLRVRKIWKPEWAVVTSVQRTGPTMILVAAGRDTKVEFNVSADALGPSIPLAAAAVRAGFASTGEMAVRVLAADGTTPLFGAAQFRKRLTGTSLVYRTDKLQLTELGWDDLDADE
ncbi:hypothetical protein OG474_41660 [Kribbella sp. NBC_01505]|uniref:hypothetical protein n=1 Tax=Kribbella sp. NBC_01505 TaxID=2903580 RepID=UPI00386CBD11